MDGEHRITRGFNPRVTKSSCDPKNAGNQIIDPAKITEDPKKVSEGIPGRKYTDNTAD